ncbi:hypothetical protein [Marinococcus sp. PL1-022]|uniref:hypothetical protein n=1 Tax=Marinococcus sp. PL1-022 TaxID=3095363 RepID=UPI0029C2BC97|nr:hypothetical protein [Marinococcus sp. PL1-022]MDX6152670.1 hypothetical protein [Marinococcus sp. PL1-022]
MTSPIMSIMVWNLLLVGTLVYLSLTLPIEWLTFFTQEGSFSLYQNLSGIALVMFLLVLSGLAATIMSLKLKKLHLIILSLLLYLSMAIETVLYTFVF